MDRKKIIYIGSLFILTVIVSITYFSYAFFTSKYEQRGKLNIVTGTLDYKLSSTLLDNTNSITLASGEKARLNIKIESLNEIASKYELFYTTTNNEIEIGYNTNHDLPMGTINKDGTKMVTVIIKNKTASQAKVTFGVEGGFTSNTLVISSGNHLIELQGGYCEVALNTVYEFPFDPDGDGAGQIQTFNVPCDGNYKLEVWGAQGGGNSTYVGGKGGYSFGNISLTKNANLYVGVGQTGAWTITRYAVLPRTYNGGGSATGSFTSDGSSTEYRGSGGGATHIAISSNLGELKNYENNKNDVLIVAGGGAGAGYFYYAPTGGTVSGNGYDAIAIDNSGTNFGQGSDGLVGAGGGYTGGGLSNYFSYGGSAYISSRVHGQAFSGSETITEPNGSTTTGHSGNGYARITFLGDSDIEDKASMGYVISFNTNGGVVSSSTRVIKIGDPIGELPVPTKGTNYFEGWYLESNFTTKVDTTYVPNGNITLYARYGTEINMNLGGRTRGYPSDTASYYTTKRSYNMNTYIVGLAFDNYYSPSTVTNYSLTSNSYYVVESAGYGIGIPMQLVSGNYRLICNLSSTAPNNTIFSIVKYKSDGTPSYYQKGYASSLTTVNFDFNIDSATSYEALVITGNGSNTSITASNIKLYKLD